MRRDRLARGNGELIYNDDCLSKLKQLDENSIQALITDPPAGISFMGKDWDSSENFIQKMSVIYAECLRVLKPGAHGLVWAIPRTSHWTATALEQAGFEIRDVVTHIFGSGFPKSLDVSKAIDKMKGAEREVVGKYSRPDGTERNYENWSGKEDTDLFDTASKVLTAPATDEAKQWQGFGTALKPASEHWILVRKPLSEPTVAKNVLKHGTGGLNIDASRIGTTEKLSIGTGKSNTYGQASSGNNPGQQHSQGRFPANLVLSHNEDCEDGCTEGCAVKGLDEQSGICRSSMTLSKTQRKWTKENNPIFGFGQASTSYNDKGTASRFFYCAKASKKDRNAGLEGMPEVEVTLSKSKGAPLPQFTKDGKPNKPMRNQNFHPTVKSTKLMEYLITLITPPNGIVLDPFMGSGSTGVAAKRLGFGFVGIEKEKDYFEIAEARLNVYSA